MGAAGFRGSRRPRSAPLATDDIYNLKEVRDPQRSPDGKWVAYVVARAIKDTDKNDTDIWMASWDGTQEIQLTSSPDGESRPRWSPDNKYLSFVSSRQGAKDGQLWLMNRAGGEAIKVSDVKGGVVRLRVGPRRQAARLRRQRARPARSERRRQGGRRDKKKTPPPIVIDRYQFKQDVDGYLRNARTHLYVFDVATKKAEAITSGTQYDESSPAWSPDSTRIAFVSKRGDGDIDRHDNTDIWVIDAKAGRAAEADHDDRRSRTKGRWRGAPTGRQIAFLAGDELKYSAYTQNRLAVVPAAGRAAALSWRESARSPDPPAAVVEGRRLDLRRRRGRSRRSIPARVSVANGRLERLVTAKSVVDVAVGRRRTARLRCSPRPPTEPAEVAALEPAGRASALRRLSHQNDAWLSKACCSARPRSSRRSARTAPRSTG